MFNLINKLVKDESGQDMAEYAIALAIVAIAAVGVGATLGTTLTQAWTTASDLVQDAMTPAA